jgi:hypothetical protein
MSTAALPAECTAWLADVDRVMKRDWCIDSSDAGWSPEDTLRYWRYGDGPEDFVVWFAEKYGLISKEQWNPFGFLFRSSRP